TDSVAVMCMDADTTKRIVHFLSAAPNGVQSMSADLPGLVQTSLNLGILRTEPQAVTASFCVRSSDPREKAALVERLRGLTEAGNGRRKSGVTGQLRISGDYPAWGFQPYSPIRQLCVEAFRDLYRTEPKIEAVHAGLECGYFADKIPGLDCVSFGPDLLDIHTTRERMRISSVQRVWRFLLEVLKRAK
ncbi:MAG: aminoacyl-histidine dipeptidase, partial [Oscillibacter sp.]|nr:aminoacyl-histidine dipeptidase [Oscillibacter sp.]